MQQFGLPYLFLLQPAQFRNVSVALDLVDDLVLFTDTMEILDYFRARRMEG